MRPPTTYNELPCSTFQYEKTYGELPEGFFVTHVPDDPRLHDRSLIEPWATFGRWASIGGADPLAYMGDDTGGRS